MERETFRELLRCSAAVEGHGASKRGRAKSRTVWSRERGSVPETWFSFYAATGNTS